MTTATTIALQWESRQERDIPGVLEGHKVSETVLVMKTKHNAGRSTRLKVSFIAPGGCGRRETGGPILPGPYAATFPLGVVIDNYGGTGAESRSLRERGLEFDVEAGDTVIIDGETYTIYDDVPLGYPQLRTEAMQAERLAEQAERKAAQQARAEAAALAAKDWVPPTPEQRREQWLADKAALAAKYPRLEGDDIQPGVPATEYVGSDSFACVVVHVERFKSGKRKGEIKAVEACWVNEDGTPRPHLTWEFPEDGGEPTSRPKYDRFLPVVRKVREQVWPEGAEWPTTVEVDEIRFYARSNGKVAWWNGLSIGYAIDYRDPSY